MNCRIGQTKDDKVAAARQTRRLMLRLDSQSLLSTMRGQELIREVAHGSACHPVGHLQLMGQDAFVVKENSVGEPRHHQETRRSPWKPLGPIGQQLDNRNGAAEIFLGLAHQWRCWGAYLEIRVQRIHLALPGGEQRIVAASSRIFRLKKAPAALGF